VPVPAKPVSWGDQWKSTVVNACSSTIGTIPVIGGYMCLPSGELIVTSEGMKPIEDIGPGDLVYTHTGHFRRVIRAFHRYYQGEIIEIRTWNNQQTIRLTPEHPLLMCETIPRYGREGRTTLDVLQWTEAAQVAEGLTAFPVIRETEDMEEIIAEKTSTYTDQWGHRRTDRWSRKFPVNTSFMTLVGYYLAEGTRSGRKGRGNMKLCFGKNLLEWQYAYEAIEAARELGLNSHVDITKYGLGVTVFSTPLMCFLEENFGYGSKNKHLPLWVLKLPKEKLESMLRAYTNGDGNLHGDSRRLTSVSRNLLEQMRLVCLKLGYQAYIHKGSKRKATIQGRKVNAHEAYELTYNEPQTRLPAKGGWLDDEYQYLRIKEVRRVPYAGLVHNLEVEDDNSYCTSAGALHNCSGIDATFGALAKILGDAFQTIYYAFDLQALLQAVEQEVNYKAAQDFNAAIASIQSALNNLISSINSTIAEDVGNVNTALADITSALQASVNDFYTLLNDAVGLFQGLSIPVVQVRNVTLAGFEAYSAGNAPIYWIAVSP